ncbi:MAG: recombinase family protein [Clostridiales Family XIII bacterium]|jgi:DNA invertase Pin-like site-specific DNA recombinase|nr:recombinase family protein [Clostridiales Family XIII bacterium]
MKIFGYIRVSATDQNDERQRIALAPFSIPQRNLYVDRQSGKDFKRPAYRRMVKRLGAGDLLIVKSIDRLGRDYDDVQEQWRVITDEIGADIRVLDMPLLDTARAKDLLGSFISDLVLQVLSFAAHFERENIRQRQAEGIAAAKARGVRFGKAPRPLPDRFDEIYSRWRQGAICVSEAAGLCGMSVRSFYERTQHLRKKRGASEGGDGAPGSA